MHRGKSIFLDGSHYDKKHHQIEKYIAQNISNSSINIHIEKWIKKKIQLHAVLSFVCCLHKKGKKGSELPYSNLVNE